MATEADNLARAQQAYATFRTGDLAGGVQLFAEDVVYVQPGQGALSGTLHGRDAVLQHIARVKTRRLRNQPQQWFATGDRVLLLTRISVEDEVFSAVDVMSFAGGEVVHFESVTDTAVMDRLYPRTESVTESFALGRLDHVAFNVQNLSASVEWYTRMLDADIVSEVQSDAAPFSIVTVEFAGIRVDLGSRPHMRKSPLAGSTPAEVTMTTGITHIAVAVEDIQQSYERLHARGVRFVSTPKPDPVSGCRYAWFADLDGNYIELMERT